MAKIHYNSCAANLFLAVLLSACKPDKISLKEIADVVPVKSMRAAFVQPKPDSTLNQRMIAWMDANLWIRETHGNNRSPIIDFWVQRSGQELGANYCGIYVGEGQMAFNLPYPSAYAWSPAWDVRVRRIPIAQADTGDVFVMFFQRLGRIGHVGYSRGLNKSGYMLYTNEGNTNEEGSRNGVGVFDRARPVSTIHQVIRWR